MLRSFLAIVFVFGLVIFIHELGHFLAAKALGVYAPRFSIGFGPALWSRKWGETEYVLAAIPLGGYVRMASRDDETMAFIEGGGEHPAPDASSGQPLPRWYDPNGMAPFGPHPVPEHRWFESKPLWARLVIMLAGVTMNMLLGFVVLTGLAWSLGEAVIRTRVVGDVRPIPAAPEVAQRMAPGDTILAVDGAPVSTWNDVADRVDSANGRRVLTLRTQRATVHVPLAPGGATADQVLYAIQPYSSPVIDQVMPDSPAERGGLQPGDSVVAVGGTPVRSWGDIVRRIESAPGRPLEFQVARKGRLVRLTITPDSMTQTDPITGQQETVGKIGAQRRTSAERLPVPLGRAMQAGWSETWGVAGAVVTALKNLATGQLSVRKLNGPIAIGRASATAARRGWEALLSLLAIVSINVAVFNLLPIPILDGGQIVLNVVEAAKGSALSARTREYLLRFGLAAIALLFVIVMFNDITNWVRNLFRL
ncbi:MAG TPA: RIP metalloprotease RseP [Gemmatimonadaceae bacterium]|nr:RIP metalloprotease RseP [Gemmatimonadaceae bacterium]